MSAVGYESQLSSRLYEKHNRSESEIFEDFLPFIHKLSICTTNVHDFDSYRFFRFVLPDAEASRVVTSLQTKVRVFKR
jgi:hypothetical protein